VVVGGNQTSSEARTLEAVSLPPAETTLTFPFPDGYELNPLAPSSLMLHTDHPQAVQAAAEHSIQVDTVQVTLQLAEGAAVFTMELTLFYCQEAQEQLCLIDMTTLLLPLTVQAGAAVEPHVHHEVSLPAAALALLR
jgi:hypothetical protein